MGLGKFLKIAAGVVFPPAGLAMGLYDAFHKKKNPNDPNLDPKNALANLYQDPSLNNYNTALSNRISTTGTQNDALFADERQGYNDIYNNAGKYNFEAAPGFRNFAQTGGLDANAINRMRGAGVFDEFAKTGGYTPDMIARLRLEASAPGAATFEALQRRLGTDYSASGGAAFNPGMSAQKIALARAAARESNAAVLAGENSIAEGIRSGRFSGAEALSGAEGNVQNALFRGKSFGLEGLTDLNKYTISQGNTERQQALTGMEGLRTNVASDVKMLDTQLQGLGMNLQTRMQMIELELKRKLGDNWWNKYGKDILGALVAGGSALMMGGKKTAAAGA